MSESEGQLSGDPAVAAAKDELFHGGPDGCTIAQPALSAGQLLRQARETAGLHIAALAVSLKVPVKKLEALEADRLELLPDAVFVRALAASVCRTLKIDAGQVLALLPQTGTPRLGHPQTAINTPFRSPGDGPGPSLWAQISRPAVLAGLLLVLGALVLIFLPMASQQNVPSAAARGGALPVIPALNIPAGQGAAATAKPDVLENNRPANAGLPAEALSPPATLPIASSPTGLPALQPELSAALSPAAGQVAPASIIVFRAKSESWVEVTDAKKVVVLRRTLAAGEAIGASGTLPLSAVVGRADATLVQVRGQPFDLDAVSKDNVARFEVK